MKSGGLSNGMGSFKINTDVAESIKKALSKKFVTRVGVLGAKTERLKKQPNESHKDYKKRVKQWMNDREGKVDGKTNAEIGLLHEKGSISQHIPRRSFLEVPLVHNLGKLDKAGKVLQKEMKSMDAGLNPETAFKKAHRELGIVGEQIVQKAFEVSGPGWQENSPVTTELKGSDSPLIDSSQLRRSVMSTVIEK